MGQEESHMVDESTPPETLQERTVDAVAQYIKSGRVRRVVVMTGAGISTSAGIPDFRSPDTGLYANLQRLDLPFAEAVFDISYFRQNPLPFYTLAHELYPGRYRPTVTHSFVRLLHDKGLLLKLFTQNIDCLEREAGVPDEKIVEAHGSFARQRCIECHTPYPDDRMHEAIRKKEVPYCTVFDCGGLVKPDIVFFGESLPEAFFNNRHLPGVADLCIIMGTSLTVQPFASLPQFAREGVPRVLINKERVGGLGSRADDVLLLGECDTGVRKLADALGWRDELEALWNATAPEGAAPAAAEAEAHKSKDELLEDEIHKLTLEVDESLKLSKEHTEWVKEGLGKGGEKAAKPQTEHAADEGDPDAQQKPHEGENATTETQPPEKAIGKEESLLPSTETAEALLHEHAKDARAKVADTTASSEKDAAATSASVPSAAKDEAAPSDERLPSSGDQKPSL